MSQTNLLQTATITMHDHRFVAYANDVNMAIEYLIHAIWYYERANGIPLADRHAIATLCTIGAVYNSLTTVDNAYTPI